MLCLVLRLMADQFVSTTLLPVLTEAREVVAEVDVAVLAVAVAASTVGDEVADEGLAADAEVDEEALVVAAAEGNKSQPA